MEPGKYRTLLLDGAGRESVSIGGIVFYKGRTEEVELTADELSAFAAADVWCWKNAWGKHYTTKESAIPGDCQGAARPLRSYCVLEPVGVIIEAVVEGPPDVKVLPEVDAAVEAFEKFKEEGGTIIEGFKYPDESVLEEMEGELIREEALEEGLQEEDPEAPPPDPETETS